MENLLWLLIPLTLCGAAEYLCLRLRGLAARIASVVAVLGYPAIFCTAFFCGATLEVTAAYLLAALFLYVLFFTLTDRQRRDENDL